MTSNDDLILAANSYPEDEWDSLVRYDVASLLKESDEKIATAMRQVQFQKRENTTA